MIPNIITAQCMVKNKSQFKSVVISKRKYITVAKQKLTKWSNKSMFRSKRQECRVIRQKNTHF